MKAEFISLNKNNNQKYVKNISNDNFDNLENGYFHLINCLLEQISIIVNHQWQELLIVNSYGEVLLTLIM